jgi:hypothetical protein
MLSKKPLIGIMFLVSLMLCIWSLPSVYGYWMYATKPPFVEDETKNVELKYFPLRVAETGYTGYGYYEGSNNGGGQKVWTFDPGSWAAGTP